MECAPNCESRPFNKFNYNRTITLDRKALYGLQTEDMITKTTFLLKPDIYMQTRYRKFCPNTKHPLYYV